MARKPTTSAPAVVIEDDSADILEDFEAGAIPPPNPQPASMRVAMPGHKGVKTMKILLEENPDIPPPGQFIGHNGTSYLLKPGVWADVPLPIIEILNNATQMVPERNAANQIIGWREKLRYPYRVAPGQMAA